MAYFFLYLTGTFSVYLSALRHYWYKRQIYRMLFVLMTVTTSADKCFVVTLFVLFVYKIVD